MGPLVSVLMPVYNAAATVGLAIASLRSQTCENWECIVVDDGSTDETGRLVQGIADNRIRYHRLDRNHGRGYARQVTLDRARGVYVTMLDADDWIYPEKLQAQLDLFKREPGLAAVSTGVALSDDDGNLVGLRKQSTSSPIVRGVMKNVAMPPFVFAPCMLPTALARHTRFDSRLLRSEDTDFLVRALAGKPYAVLTRPMYVYQERVSLRATISGLGYCCTMFRKHLPQHPLESVKEIARARAKQVIYCTTAALGFWDRLVARRSRHPLETEIEDFNNARRIVISQFLESTLGPKCPIEGAPLLPMASQNESPSI